MAKTVWQAEREYKIEMDAFDSCPPAVRQVMREMRAPVIAAAFLKQIKGGVSESEIIAYLRRADEAYCQRWRANVAAGRDKWV